MLSIAIGIAMPTVGQTVSSVYSFSGQSSSGQPIYVVPTQGRNGKLYGTTYGPTGSSGSIFRLTTKRLATQVYTFGTDGGNPTAGLSLATDGNFYGSTTIGGSTK